MTAMPHLSAIGWDWADRMQTADLGGGGDVYFVYDSAGQRVWKVWQKTSTLRDERIYLGGYEIFRSSTSGSIDTERETLHVMDDQRRVAMVETLTISSGSPVGSPTSRQRYQIGNQLESVAVELTETGATIGYEEFYPFGSTSFHSADGSLGVSAKRYRYTGKERDDETGLYYHGARYYAAWLGRWTACDPASISDGVNRFVYVNNRPTVARDPNGRESFLEGLHQKGTAALNVAGRILATPSPAQASIDLLQRAKEAAVAEAKAQVAALPKADEPAAAATKIVQGKVDVSAVRGVVNQVVAAAKAAPGAAAAALGIDTRAPANDKQLQQTLLANLPGSDAENAFKAGQVHEIGSQVGGVADLAHVAASAGAFANRIPANVVEDPWNNAVSAWHATGVYKVYAQASAAPTDADAPVVHTAFNLGGLSVNAYELAMSAAVGPEDLAAGAEELAIGERLEALLANNRGALRIGPNWVGREITEAVCETGCGDVAIQIQKQIGGDIVRLTPMGDAPTLGGFRGKNWGWSYHEVVVKNGRVFDLTTGYEGVATETYKKLWQYPDAIKFGF